MAFCKSCGADIADGDKFCTKCGTPVDRTENIPQTEFDSARQETVEEQELYISKGDAPESGADGKNGFDKKIALIIAAAVLILIGVTVAGILVMNGIRHKQVNKSKTIDVNRYIEIDVNGYNGQGRAEINLDYTEFYDAVFNAVGGSKANGSRKYEYKTTASNICRTVSFVVTPDSGLSNGDKVKVEMLYDEDVLKDTGIVLEFKSLEKNVSGLKDAKKVDIFQYLEMTFNGRSGSVWVICENNAKEKGLKDVRFTVENNYNLSVGDEFTVRVDDYHVNMLRDNYGIELESTLKTYKIDKNDVDRYIESISDISDGLFDIMDGYALEEIENTYEWKWETEISDIQYMGMYLLYPNESSTYYENYVFMIYTAEVTLGDEDREPVKVFLPVQVSDLVCFATGEQECSSWVNLWDDGRTDGDYACTGYLSERDMFLDIMNEENLMNFMYEISAGMRDYYDYPIQPGFPADKETGAQTGPEEIGTDRNETMEEIAGAR